MKTGKERKFVPCLSYLYYQTISRDVILPLSLLFLSFQLGLLCFLSLFQTLHETGFLHRFLFILFQLGQQLIFVNRITEDHRL